jgi:hypothetical protein
VESLGAPSTGTPYFVPRSADYWTLSFSNTFLLCFPEATGFHPGRYTNTDQFDPIPVRKEQPSFGNWQEDPANYHPQETSMLHLSRNIYKSQKAGMLG